MQRIYAAAVGVTMALLVIAELAGWRALAFDPLINRIHAITLVAAGASLQRLSYFTPRRLALWCGVGFTALGLIGISAKYAHVVMPHTNPAEAMVHLIIGLAGLFMLVLPVVHARIPHGD